MSSEINRVCRNAGESSGGSTIAPDGFCWCPPTSWTWRPSRCPSPCGIKRCGIFEQIKFSSDPEQIERSSKSWPIFLCALAWISKKRTSGLIMDISSSSMISIPASRLLKTLEVLLFIEVRVTSEQYPFIWHPASSSKTLWLFPASFRLCW